MALLFRMQNVFVFQKCCQQTLATSRTYHYLSRFVDPPQPCGRRSFINKFRLFRKPSQRELKEKDDIPDTCDLIYRNTMNNYIWSAQIVSIVTGGLLFITLLVKRDLGVAHQAKATWSSTSRRSENEEMFYMAFFIVIFALMQMMFTRLPLRIYKVPGTIKYIAVGPGNYLFGNVRFSFERGQIAQMEETGFLPWKSNRFLIKTETETRPIILIEHYFRRPADFNIMLGFQRDPDLEE